MIKDGDSFAVTNNEKKPWLVVKIYEQLWLIDILSIEHVYWLLKLYEQLWLVENLSKEHVDWLPYVRLVHVQEVVEGLDQLLAVLAHGQLLQQLHVIRGQGFLKKAAPHP